MKRFGANKIHLSETECYCNAVLEITDDGILHKIISLNDHSETSNTPFFNGILAPFPPQTCNSLHFDNKQKAIGETIEYITLLEGDNLLSQGKIDHKRVVFQR